MQSLTAGASLSGSEPKSSTFARLGRLSILIKLARLGLDFVSATLFARLMDPSDFGVYAIALSASVILALPGEAGMAQLAIREVARGRVSGDWAGLKGLIHFANSLVAALSIGVVLIAAIALHFLSGRIGARQTLAIASILGAVVLGSLANTRSGILRGFGSAVISQIPEQLMRPGTMILVALAAPILGIPPLSPKTTAWLCVGASAVAFVVGTLLLRRAIKTAFPMDAAGVERRIESRA